MRKFCWKAIINKMGKENFVLFIAILFFTIYWTVELFKDLGIGLVVESAVLSYLFANFKEAKNAIKEVNENFSIEERKNKKKEMKEIKNIEKEVKI